MIYILILLTLSAIADYFLNIFNKLFDFPIVQKGIKIFLYITYIFPILASTLALYFINNLEMKDVFTSILSYYATALSITLTTYTFYKKQKEKIDELETERKKVVRENIELKKRELEAEMDHYRPLFAVGGKEVKLIMKEPHLYLENIEYYKYDRGVYTRDPGRNIKNISTRFVKSEKTIIENPHDIFCITGNTQKGENVLFFNHSIGNYHFKTYKYIKDNNLLFPKKIDLECYTLEKINQIWGSYNTSNNNYNDMNDQDLFKSTIHITMLLNPFFSCYHEKSLNSISFEHFFENIFTEIKDNYIDHREIKNTKLLYRILSEFINYVYIHVKYVEFNINIVGENDFKIRDRYNDLTTKIKALLPKITNKYNDDLCNSLFDAKLHKYSEVVSNILNIKEFLNIIKKYLSSNISQEKSEIKSILEVLIILFSLVTFNIRDMEMDDLNKLKGYSANLLNV